MDGSRRRGVGQRRPCFERLEPRYPLAQGVTVLPGGSLEVQLDDAFDQFGFQPSVFQAYDDTPENGFEDALSGFSVFDSGASVVTFGANDQLLFDLLGSNNIPIQVECGAVAEAVGGLSLIGHVSKRGTVLADGIHVSSLSFDEDGFPIFQLGFHQPVQGTIVDPMNSSSDLAGDSDLSGANDAYAGHFFVFTSGGLRGSVREVATYHGPTRTFGFLSPFAHEPAAGDQFLLVAPEVPYLGVLADNQIAGGQATASAIAGSDDLNAQDDFYQGAYVQFTSGALTGQIQQISDYSGETRTFHFASPFTDAPRGGTYRVLQINTSAAAIAPNIQAFIGTHVATPPEGCPEPASPTLPSLAGTPILSPSPDHPDGLSVNIRPFGAFLDFSEFAGFEGFLVPVPDVQFYESGAHAPADPACLVFEEAVRNICTPTFRMPLDFLGNLVDDDGGLTEAYNPVHRHVTSRHRDPNSGQLIELSDQVFLFDTGAQLSVISPAQAEAFGLDLNNPEDTISVQTAGGVISDLPGYRIDSLVVPLENDATLTFKNVWVFVVDAAPGLLDGILGMNLFNNSASMLYDPWNTSGPVLELVYFTESPYKLPFAEVFEVEPNDVPTEATPLRRGEFGVGGLNGSDRVDYWASPGVRAGDLIFAYADTQAATENPDATLSLLDKNESVLEFDDNDGPGTSPILAGVSIPAGLAGTAFYEVRDRDNGPIAQYHLYVSVVNPAEVTSENEPGTGVNESPETATPFVGTAMSGTLGFAPGSGDMDHYGVVAVEGSRIVVMVDNDPDRDGAFAGTRISILGPDGSVLFPEATEFDGDGNAAASGAVSRIRSTGTYVVKIHEGQLSGDNDYRFAVQVLDGGSELLSAQLVQSAATRKSNAERVVSDYENALAACGPDLFCQADVLLQYLGLIGEAAAEMAQSELVLSFAHTISGSAMPTFASAGSDLVVSIDAPSISEFGGSTTAIVSRPGTSGDLIVTLTSSDPSEATITTTARIPHGKRTSLPIPISASDDTLADGTQNVTIRASAVGFKPGTDSILVSDYEPLIITTASNSILERTGSTTATVSRPGTVGNLIVSLESNDPGEAFTIAQITIPDGQSTSPSFLITAGDDSLRDGTQTVLLSAKANGYLSVKKELHVTDDETARPWQNPIQPIDVDGDNIVAPIDALLIINDINAFGARELIAPSSGSPPPFFDTNADGFLSSLDALLVINALNQRPAAEGETLASSDTAITALNSLHHVFADFDLRHDDWVGHSLIRSRFRSSFNAALGSIEQESYRDELARDSLFSDW